MYSKWTAHLKDLKDQEDFKESIYRARSVLDRLKAIIEENEASIDISERSPKTYDCANWSHLQAHYNGAKQHAHLVKSLLTNREETTNGRSVPNQQRSTFPRSEQEIS